MTSSAASDQTSVKPVGKARTYMSRRMFNVVFFSADGSSFFLQRLLVTHSATCTKINIKQLIIFVLHLLFTRFLSFLTIQSHDIRRAFCLSLLSSSYAFSFLAFDGDSVCTCAFAIALFILRYIKPAQKRRLWTCPKYIFNAIVMV